MRCVIFVRPRYDTNDGCACALRRIWLKLEHNKERLNEVRAPLHLTFEAFVSDSEDRIEDLDRNFDLRDTNLRVMSRSTAQKRFI